MHAFAERKQNSPVPPTVLPASSPSRLVKAGSNDLHTYEQICEHLRGTPLGNRLGLVENAAA
jgi:hypothetical protein